MKIIALSAVTLSLVVITLLAAGSREEPPTYRVSHGPVRGDCSFNRVLPNEKGTAALWSDGSHDPTGVMNWTGPSSFVLVGSDGLGRDARLRIVTSDRRLAPIRWSPDSNSLSFRAGDYVSTWTPGTEPPKGGRLLPSAWRNVRVKALARGGLEFLDDAALNADLAALRRRGDVIRTMVTIGSTNHVFGLSEQTGLPLISIDKGVSKPVGVSATSLTDPMILSDAKGGSTLLHVGYTPKLSDDGSRLPYIRPLIDHATGSVIGRFGQRDIAFEPGHFAEPRSLQAWIGDGWIVDAAADGNFLTLLIRNPDRSMRLVHGKKGGISSTPVCEDRNFIVDERLRLKSVPADPRRLQAVADLDVRTWNPDRSEADPTMPIGQLYTKKGAHKAQLLVYFHGGPASSLWNVGIPKIVEELSGPNRTILTVETSGSTGAGLPLAQALARFGPAAIERDVRLVADWAKSQNYRDVQIVAESFGAVSALAAIQADPSLFKRAYFIAPLIRLRDPMEWTGRGRSVPNTAHQLASEHAMFGGPAGREKMRAWLETHWTSYARGRDDRFYFAAADDVSKPSDMPGAARPDLQMTVYKGTNHEFISGRPEIWADIRSALDAPLEVQGPTKAQAVPKPVVSRRGSTPALRKAVSQRELTSQS